MNVSPPHRCTRCGYMWHVPGCRIQWNHSASISNSHAHAFVFVLCHSCPPPCRAKEDSTPTRHRGHQRANREGERATRCTKHQTVVQQTASQMCANFIHLDKWNKKHGPNESIFWLLRVKHGGRKAEADAKRAGGREEDSGGVLVKGGDGGRATAERRVGSRLPTLKYFPKHSP